MIILMLRGKEPDDDREKHHEEEEEQHPPARVSRVMKPLDMDKEVRDIEQRVADEETETAIHLVIRETGGNLRDGVRKHRGDDGAEYPKGNNPEPEGLAADTAGGV